MKYRINMDGYGERLRTYSEMFALNTWKKAIVLSRSFYFDLLGCEDEPVRRDIEFRMDQIDTRLEELRKSLKSYQTCLLFLMLSGILINNYVQSNYIIPNDPIGILMNLKNNLKAIGY